MQTNPEKLQAICTGKKSHDRPNGFDIKGTEIVCRYCVKPLDVDIDFLLNFNIHI